MNSENNGSEQNNNGGVPPQTEANPAASPETASTENAGAPSNGSPPEGTVTIVLSGAKRGSYSSAKGEKLKTILANVRDPDSYTFRVGKSEDGPGHPVSLDRVINEDMQLYVVSKAEQA